MGKKILTEAGYEVVAVSNGAAAVKKIAEQKPDIIILDVYMPGYSGLEVCEKVRSSIATIKTPVLLTVGKMEPYKPEDANRVRADGVIIKPFEASDLLAIVKKFEERIVETATAAPPPPPPAVREEINIPAPEPSSNHEPPPRLVQPMVEVPDHMATSSAFSDLLGTDATRMENFYVPPVREAAVPPVRPEAAAAVVAPDYDVPASWRPEPEPQPVVIETSKAAAAPAGAAAVARPLQIPVYQEPEPSQFEVVPTAAAPVGDIEIPREAGLQENAHETTRKTIADLRDPDLVPTAHHITPPATAQSVAAPVIEVEPSSLESVEEVSVLAQPEEAQPAPETVAQIAEAFSSQLHAHAPSLSEADFEARVAAAMAAYSQAVEPVEAAPVVQQERALSVAPTADETQALPVMEDIPAPPVASVDQPAAIESAPEPQISHAAPTPELAEEPVSVAVSPNQTETAESFTEQEPVEAAAQSVIAARVEAELPAVAEAVVNEAAAGEKDHATIAQAVHRVMERMKENLVEEIVRELKTKK